MSITLALADAARNCANDHRAQATVTLKSGVQLTGTLRVESGADLGTRHIKIGRGWATFLTDEVAAVESHE